MLIESKVRRELSKHGYSLPNVLVLPLPLNGRKMTDV